MPTPGLQTGRSTARYPLVMRDIAFPLRHLAIRGTAHPAARAPSRRRRCRRTSSSRATSTSSSSRSTRPTASAARPSPPRRWRRGFAPPDFRRPTSSSAARLRAKATSSCATADAPAPRRKPLLLLAHLDVVEAKKEDWSPDLDPFTFIEKDGYFYGRGTTDDKAMAAIFVANLLRMKQQGLVPERDIVLALTADEEGGDYNGVEWLLANHRALVDAEYGLNEGGGGQSTGRPQDREPRAGEREGLRRLHARGRRTRAATARSRSPRTRSTSWRTRSRSIGEVRVSGEAERGDARATSRRWRHRAGPGRRGLQGDRAAHAGRRPRSRGSRRCRSTTRCCARPASRRWSTAVTRRTRCRSARRRTSTAASCPARIRRAVQQTLARVIDNPKITITPVEAGEAEPAVAADARDHADDHARHRGDVARRAGRFRS